MYNTFSQICWFLNNSNSLNFPFSWACSLCIFSSKLSIKCISSFRYLICLCTDASASTLVSMLFVHPAWEITWIRWGLLNNTRMLICIQENSLFEVRNTQSTGISDSDNGILLIYFSYKNFLRWMLAWDRFQPWMFTCIRTRITAIVMTRSRDGVLRCLKDV